MKVKVIMTTDIGFCNLSDDLTKVALIMWQKDCGIVPLVNEENKVVGMITDRDICIAVASRNKKTSCIKAVEFIKDDIISCAEDDKIEKALKKMKKYKLKRLPVTGKNDELVGILSIADILAAKRKNKKLIKKVYRTLTAIAAPRPILLIEV